MHTTTIKSLCIVGLLVVLGGIAVAWITPTPPPPLPEVHSVPPTAEDVALFAQWAAWMQHVTRILYTIGLATMGVIGVCACGWGGRHARSVCAGAALMLLVIGGSFYLVNTFIQREAVRMTQELADRG